MSTPERRGPAEASTRGVAEDAVLRSFPRSRGRHCRARSQAREAWGRSDPGNVPAGFEEHVQPHVPPQAGSPSHRRRMGVEEKSGVEVVEHRFAFRWATLERAAASLSPRPAMWIESVRTSLRHP